MPPKASTRNSSNSRNTDDIVFVKGPQASPSTSNKNKTPIKNRVASSSASTSASPASTPARQSAAFQPGTTPVKFYEDEMQARPSSARSSLDTRRSSKPTATGFSLKKLAIQLTTLYALIAYFVICPNDPSRAPAVCKSYTDLQQYRNQALAYVTPYFQPYLSQAQNTISAQTEPYVKAASPYYSQAAKIVSPQVQKASSAYEKQVRPRLADAVTHSRRAILPHTDKISGEYNRLVTPHVNRYSKLATELYDINAKPYVDEVYFEYQRKIKPFYTTLYSKTHPYVSKVYPTMRHHFRHTFLPAAAASYSTSVNTYNKHIHPNLLNSVRFTGRVLSDNVLPSVRRFQSRYIAPQLSKIQDKAWAYKAKKVADEKVEQMDADLGKSDIQDEIEELLSEIRAESMTVSATVGTTAAPIQPTAFGDAGIESKDDPLSHKLQEDAERVRLNAEKRKALEALHDLYEVEIPKLGETELALLADRLSALRKAALRDIPIRFDPAIKSYKAESDKWLGRLEKYWDKADRDERTDVERKVSDGNLIARKAIVKMADAADEFEDEVDAYARTHTVRELTSVERAFKTIQSFVGKAQEELGNGYAWLDDVSAKDWTRYHTLAAIEGSWHHKLFSLKNGTISHPTLDRKLDVEATLNKLKQDIEKANNEFERKLGVARVQGEKRAKGEFLGVKDAAARGAAAVAGAFEEATKSAVSIVAGTPEVTPSNIQESASSIFAQATDSAASLYSSAPPLTSIGSEAYSSAESLASAASKSGESLLAEASAALPIYVSDVSSTVESLAFVASTGLQAAASSLSSALLPSNVQKALDDAQATLAYAYGEASQTLLRAAGVEPSPTDLSQSANSVYNQATAYLADYQASASSLLASYASEASKTAYSLAGQPTATGYQASAESAYAIATASAASYADSLVSEISSAAANAQSLAQKVAGDAYALLPTLPETTDLPAVSDITSTLSSQLHQATREALKAVGVSVTPESLQEHAESLYNQAGFAGQGVLSDLSSSIHSATRAAASAAGYTPSPESPAEFAASVYDRASSAAASVGADAQALAEDASSSVRSRARSVAKAAGYTPSPESPGEHVESVYNVAANSASSLASSISQAAPSIPSASDIYSGANSVLSEASATASSAGDVISSALHSATRSVASAFGAEVTPEGASEYIASAASSVSSVASKASQAVRDRVEL